MPTFTEPDVEFAYAMATLNKAALEFVPFAVTVGVEE